MAVLAVYILLALVATGVGHEQRDAPTSPPPPSTSPPPPSTSPPPPPPTPAPTISTPEAASATEAPPTPAPPTLVPFHRRETGRSTFIRKMLSKRNRRDPPLYNYALLNAARSLGRAIVHSQRESCKDAAEVVFCPCDEKLHTDAMQYQEFGAVERWCVDYPEDLREMGVDEDNEETDDDEEENVFRPENMIPLTSSSSSSSVSDRMNGTASTEPTAVPDSNSATPSLGNWQTYTSHAHSASLEISPATFSPESQLPSASHAFRGGNQPGASWYEMADDTIESRYHNQSDHIVQSVQGTHPARQLDNTLPSEETIRLGNDQLDQERRDIPQECNVGDDGGDRSEGCSIQLPAATPEQQPVTSGDSGVPSQNTNSRTPVRSENEFSGYEQDVIFLVDHDTEVFDPSEMALQLKDDVNKELERLFGVRQDSEEPSLHKPDMKPCYGEVEVAVLGTKESPSYVVDMKCHREPDICPPSTVCSAVFDHLTEDDPEQVPLLKYMRDTWQRDKFPRPTGCFCAPRGYSPRDLKDLA